MIFYGIENKMVFQPRHIFEKSACSKDIRCTILVDIYFLFNFNHGVRYADAFPNHVIIQIINEDMEYSYQVLDLRNQPIPF